MSNPNRTVDTLTTEVFALISTAQRNGMTSTDAITVGIQPFLTRLLELERFKAYVHRRLDEAGVPVDVRD